MKYQANDNLEIMKYAKNYNDFLANLVSKQIKQLKANNIADFGCADGFFISKIKSNLNTQTEFIGIEQDEDSLQKCLSKKITAFKTLEKIEKQDIIYSFNVLEHIEDDENILKLMHSKIKEGGKLILFLPAIKFLTTSMDKKAGHFRRYSKKNIRQKLTNTGFDIEKIEYFDFIGAIFTLIYKFFDNFFSQNGNITKKQILFFDSLFKLNKFITEFFFKKLFGKNLIIIANIKK